VTKIVAGLLGLALLFALLQPEAGLFVAIAAIGFALIEPDDARGDARHRNDLRRL
jgi:hypothetical protein